MAYTEQQYNAAIQKARAVGDTEAVDYLRAERLKLEKPMDATAGMSGLQKGMANIGAGMDSAWQGAKQLVGQGEGDEAIREKRMRDAALADKTTGGGLLQIAGELAPAVALGGGVGVAARALPAAVQASRGMQLAGRAMSNPALRGAAEGAGAAALVPTMGDESRLQNVALGAAGGAAAPYVLKGAVAAARKTGHGAQRMAASVSDTAAKGAARRDLGRQLQRAGIDEAEAAGTKYKPHPFVGTKPSAAIETQSPKLADIELASRNASRAEWMPFDEANQVARWKALDENLATSGTVDDLLSKANEVGAQVPYQAVGPKRFVREMDDFYDKLTQAKATAQYHGNPAVRSAVDYIENTMREAGEVTPELLHQIRQTISKGLTGAPGAGEAGVRAAAKEPFVISLSQAMDNVLDKSSKGKWGGWKEDYGQAMTRAESAKADVNIRNMFIDEATGTVRKPVAGLADDVPQVTPHALKQAIAKAGSAKRGPRKGQNLLSTGSEDVLRGVEKDLNAQSLLQRAKAASTGGSGSDTAPNIIRALALEAAMPGAGIAKYVHEVGRQNIGEAQRKALAEVLQDPKKLRAFLQAQALRQQKMAKLPYVPGAGAAVMLPAMD
jgi:hypothetical protein